MTQRVLGHVAWETEFPSAALEPERGWLWRAGHSLWGQRCWGSTGVSLAVCTTSRCCLAVRCTEVCWKSTGDVAWGPCCCAGGRGVELAGRFSPELPVLLPVWWPSPVLPPAHCEPELQRAAVALDQSVVDSDGEEGRE